MYNSIVFMVVNAIKTKGVGIRPTQSYNAKNCPWSLRLTYQEKKGKYLIKSFENDHNNTHPTTEEFFKFNPTQRKLDQEQQQMVYNMLTSGAKVALVADTMQKLTGKKVTTRDIHNIRTKLSNHEIIEDLTNDKQMNQLNNWIEKRTKIDGHNAFSFTFCENKE